MTLDAGVNLARRAGVWVVAVSTLAMCLLGARGALTRELERSGATALGLLAPRLAVLAAAGERHATAETLTASVSGAVAFLVVRDAQGQVVGQAFAERLGVGVEALPQVRPAAKGPVLLGHHRVAFFSAPLGAAGANGTVELGLFVEGIERELATIAVRASAVLAALLAGLWGLGRMADAAASRRARRLAEAAAQIARGDLGQSLEVDGQDVIAQLGRSFDETAGSLRAMVVELRATAQSVEVEARSLLETSSRQSGTASQHSEELIDAALTIGEIASGAQLASEQADSVIASASQSEAMIESGTRSVEDTRSAMEKIGEQMEVIAGSIDTLVGCTAHIGRIVSTVQDLAEQSNLLALNASIEASRAGDSGRGFAVVAQEMRNLANQSKTESAQIRALLTALYSATRAAVGAAQEGSARATAGIAIAQTSRSAIDGLASVIGGSSEAARTIADQSRAQADGIQQVATLLNELSSAMKHSLEQAQGIEKVASNLSSQSSGLARLTERYRV